MCIFNTIHCLLLATGLLVIGVLWKAETDTKYKTHQVGQTLYEEFDVSRLPLYETKRQRDKIIDRCVQENLSPAACKRLQDKYIDTAEVHLFEVKTKRSEVTIAKIRCDRDPKKCFYIRNNYQQWERS